MNNIKKEEAVLEIEEFLDTNNKQKNRVLARRIYEKFIEHIEQKLLKRESKYTEGYYNLLGNFNKMMNLAIGFAQETVKEKEERIEYLEGVIKKLVNEPPESD